MTAPLKPSVSAVVRGADQLGETPLWCERTQQLWWIDIERPALQSFDPATGAHHRRPMPGTFFGSQALTRTGERLVAVDLELRLLDVDSAAMAPFTVVETDLDNRLNDGRVDPRGRLWIGTMDNALHRPQGSFYRVDADGGLTRMATDIVVSNGIAFSPDGRTLYFTDTRRHRSYAFDLDLDDGTITNRRLFADYSTTGERPDGACIDVDGCLWTAFFAGGRIVRYRPDGRIDRTIQLPVSNPTCVAFGGPDLKTLYVTSATKFLTPAQRAAEPLAGSLLAVEGLGQGLPEHRFGPIARRVSQAHGEDNQQCRT